MNAGVTLINIYPPTTSHYRDALNIPGVRLPSKIVRNCQGKKKFTNYTINFFPFVSVTEQPISLSNIWKKIEKYKRIAFQDFALTRKSSSSLIRASKHISLCVAEIFKEFETLRKVGKPVIDLSDIRSKSSRSSISGLIDHIYVSLHHPPLFLLRLSLSRFVMHQPRAHVKACSGHFRRRGGTRPFHQDIRYAICPLRAPTPRNTPRPGGDDDRL